MEIRSLNIKNGFTIIELVIVIIIILVLTAVVPVSINRYLVYQDLDIAVEKLTNSLKQIQVYSKNYSDAELIFDAVNKRYCIKYNDFSDTVNLPKNIFFKYNPLKISFNHKGLSNSVSGDTIILSNNINYKTIIVKSVTGEIIIKN